jgi:hypothetical protein
VKAWLDSVPWWSIAAVSFVLGALLGQVLRVARRSKYESRES